MRLFYFFIARTIIFEIEQYFSAKHTPHCWVLKDQFVYPASTTDNGIESLSVPRRYDVRVSMA